MKHSQEYKDFVSNVCKASGCEQKYLTTKIRKQEFVRARYLIIAFRYKIEKLSPEKAVAVFTLNRANAYHAIKVIKRDYSTSKSYREMFAYIFNQYPKLIQ